MSIYSNFIIMSDILVKIIYQYQCIIFDCKDWHGKLRNLEIPCQLNSKFQVTVFGPICNNNSEFLSDTWNHIGRENSKLSFIALYPKTITHNFTFTHGIILGSENFTVPSYCFYPTPKTITWNFSESTKAFNLENIVQACLIFSKTHRVNKDFWQFHKRLGFLGSSYHFLV